MNLQAYRLGFNIKAVLLSLYHNQMFKVNMHLFIVLLTVSVPAVTLLQMKKAKKAPRSQK